MTRQPYFQFENIATSERLEFELLSEANYSVILEMFADDDSPFIQVEYKQAEKLEAYAHWVIRDGAYQAKRGQADWLFKLKSSGEYVGLLNLYDLSLETFNEHNKKCSLGFTCRKTFRRRYYTVEAVHQLMQHTVTTLHRTTFLAYTEKANISSQALLAKMEFENVTSEYGYKNHYEYYRKEMPLSF